MQLDGAAVPRFRGRVVMLVDNGVNGDSRVQKMARSAAESGWEVILLGLSPEEKKQAWQLGKAKVELLPITSSLGTRRHHYRRPWLRGPLAYPPTGIAAYRSDWVKALRADLWARRAELDLQIQSGQSKSRRLIRETRWLAERIAVALLGRWVRLRHRQLTAARRARKRLDGPWDRLYAFFWQTVRGDRSWRRLYPQLWDYELAFGPVLDELAPDLIHANDFRMLGVGARAVLRARAAGRSVKLVWDAHEFLPGVRPRVDNVRWHRAHCGHEREYAPYADAVMTVSERLAELLQERHGLTERPTVVLNAPALDHGPTGDLSSDPTPGSNLRDLCGIGQDVPLLVYSGAAAEQRGVSTMIEALPQLPDVHVALVVNKPSGPYMQKVMSQATELGVADRVHALPYVPYWQVVPFLSGADVGVIPIHHYPNHELALITKFFEYSHARLPIVVSDVRTMAQTVRSTGQGEVFRAEDVDDYIRAVRAVLDDPQRYRAVYDEPGLLENWTWEAQAKVLDEVYTRVLSSAVSEPTRRTATGDLVSSDALG